MKNIILTLIICSVIASCKRSNKELPHTYNGKTQGTTFFLKYYSGDDTLQIINGIDSILLVIEKTASLYDTLSIISLVNNNKETRLNEHFINLFNKSFEVSEATNGYFDITVAPLVKAYGFLKQQGKEISKKQIDSLIKFVGYKKARIKNSKLYKDFPEVQLDFNAIAQGYTVDIIADYLQSKNISNYVIEIGGEVRASGTKIDNSNWVAGIEKPAENQNSSRRLQVKVALKNKAIATSGNYRNYFVENGVKYSHTINPFDGCPVQHTLLSVSVITDKCADADAYATAFMVMGKEKAMEFLKRNKQFDAYFIYSDQLGKNKVTYTEGFKKFLTQ